MPEAYHSFSERGAETPLLHLDNDNAMTDFWSPSKLPAGSLAPPSSPKLNGISLISGNQRYLSPHDENLEYLHQQLGDQSSEDNTEFDLPLSFHQPMRRFSWQTEYSVASDEDYAAEDLYSQQISSTADDGATLVNISSSDQSSSSETNTLSGSSMDSSCPVFACWRENLPKLQNGSRSDWSATVPVRRSAAARSSVIRRLHSTTFSPPKCLASHSACPPPSKAVSSSILESNSAGPTSSSLFTHQVDMRANSWPGFQDEPYGPVPASRLQHVQSEKSSWDPDTSDEEQEQMLEKEPGLGKLRRKFGRRVSDTLRPLFFRSS